MYLTTKLKPTFWRPGLAAPGTHLLDRLRQRVAYWQRWQQFDEQARHLTGLKLVAAVLSCLDLTIEVAAVDVSYLPARGAFLAIVDQPGGLLASLVVLHVLGQARPDLRLVLDEAAAPLLARLTEQWVAAKKPTGRGGAAGLRPLLRQLHHEVPLAVFPLAQAEPGYFSATAERLLTTMRLPIVPVALSCQRPAAASWWEWVPSLLYQPSKLLSELLDQQGATVRVRLGAAVRPAELHGWPHGARLAYLRARLAALAPVGAADSEPVLPPAEAASPGSSLLEADLAALPAKRRLVHCQQWEVYVAKAPELPHLLPEIDRLRARTLGPGSSELLATPAPEVYFAQDCYRYLVLYDRRARRLVGACRLGHGKRILRQRGRQGFSLHATCKLRRALCPLLRQSLELTQAFIRAEYQGQALPLGLVWEGLAQYLSEHPQYRYLLGPISLSPSTLPVSKAQLLDFMQHCPAAEAAAHVRPRKLVRYHPLASGAPVGLPAHLTREQLLQALLGGAALGGVGVPLRLRPYFCQQAQLLSVHLDPAGSDTVQGTVLLDAAALGNYTYRLAARTTPHPSPLK